MAGTGAEAQALGLFPPTLLAAEEISPSFQELPLTKTCCTVFQDIALCFPENFPLPS